MLPRTDAIRAYTDDAGRTTAQRLFDVALPIGSAFQIPHVPQKPDLRVLQSGSQVYECSSIITVEGEKSIIVACLWVRSAGQFFPYLIHKLRDAEAAFKEHD
jgi:hypothetical protein